MTKTVYITELQEIKGLKIECECGASWYIPTTTNSPPAECIACKTQIPAKEIWKFNTKINDLITLSKNGKFKILFETDFKDKHTKS